MASTGYNITAVERDTGLSKDVLRMWERRYGFPVPERDHNGERVYSPAQVEHLRLVKRLMDQGHRPGRLLTTPLEELAELAPRRASKAPRTPDAQPLQPLLDLIKAHDSQGFQQALQQRLGREGLLRFVQDTVAPLTELVGEAWTSGYFAVFEEHLYTEQMKRALRQAIAALPHNQHRPCVILTTPPDELHGLGLLMVEALFTLEGARCVALGTQTPISDICLAADAHQADVVAISLSAAFPARQVAPLLAQLRQALPERVELWAGGSAVERVSTPDGVQLTPTLPAALAALDDWRARHA
ncbi:MAG TPA: MerR family transcriptional regulator [Rhodocyclaceae bacterium]|nr:MerR family transcriptional regulator [Rhodocyclaceae bacterium]